MQFVERAGWPAWTLYVLFASVLVRVCVLGGLHARTLNAWFASVLFVREVFAHLRDGDVAVNLPAETLIIYRRCERCVEHVVTHTRTQVVDQRFAAFKLVCI